MGITEFTTLSGACGLEYQWEYGVGGATTGVSVLPSITISSIGGLNTSISSYFYLATWNCDPLHPYFNITALQCQNSCAYYYFGNTTALDCQLCSNTLCYTCSNNDSTICLSCDTTLHYVLSSGTCVCASGYYSLNGSCVLCSTGQAECVTCTYTMSNITVLFLLTNFNCTSCNATNNYFVQKNVTTLIYECIKCTLSNCLSCASLTTCLVCDPASGTSLSAALQCSLCSVTGCLTCGAISTVCLVCNGALGYTLDGTGCSLCAVACNCLGWVLPWISNKASCSTICGDGFIVGSE